VNEDHKIEISIKLAQGHCADPASRFWGPPPLIATEKMKSSRDVVVIERSKQRNVVRANVVD
jgi:hypothetical protein